MGTEHNYVEWRRRWRWPKVVVNCQTGEAVDLLQRYYATFDGGHPATRERASRYSLNSVTTLTTLGQRTLSRYPC